jgi:hypothetical protein
MERKEYKPPVVRPVKRPLERPGINWRILLK